MTLRSRSKTLQPGPTQGPECMLLGSSVLTDVTCPLLLCRILVGSSVRAYVTYPPLLCRILLCSSVLTQPYGAARKLHALDKNVKTRIPKRKVAVLPLFSVVLLPACVEDDAGWGMEWSAGTQPPLTLLAFSQSAHRVCMI
eukprot:2374487-Rhodomonas_salina.2